ETWEGEVRVGGDIIIPEGVKLTVEPQTVVKVVPNRDLAHSGIDTTRAEIIVEGDITFKEGGDPSRFISDSDSPEPGDWYGIRYVRMREGEEGSEKANIGLERRKCRSRFPTAITKEEDNRGKRAVKNTEIYHAESGISGEGVDLGLKDVEIRDCNFGVYSTSWWISLNRTSVVSCDTGIFSNSWITKARSCKIDSNGIGILINDGILNQLRSNSFSGNSVGLMVKGLGDRGKEVSVVKADQELIREKVSAIRSAEEIINHLPIDRQIPGLAREGSDCGVALISDNAFAKNDTGLIFAPYAIALVRKNDLIGDGIGVYIDDAWPMLGLGMCGKNKIVSVQYSVYNNSPFYILAEGNYWGTVDPDSIAKKIYDHYDDPALGIVDFEPYWDGGDAFAGGPQSGGEQHLLFSIAPIASPSFGSIDISYQLVIPVQIEISIFDPVGRRLFFQNKRESAGYHRINKNLPAGVYFVKIKALEKELNQKVVVIKG
ncbi:MAG TPA: T9SS type A sorting domain-containing protein, partial [bacterium (Candidatus Stahlbacteria)]|nr:T9SS type A sorting domain-containing protein [Candidatus Stahlbacteria bacterium]